MSFRVTSWNIKEFGKKPKSAAALKKRVKAVAAHIRGQTPDVFGLMEIESINILDLMEDEFPNFDFGFTDGQDGQDRNNKEILVGWHKDKFDQAVFSQKRQFRLYNPYLRPGALLSVKQNGNWYNMLFLHTDSGTEARDFGNRFEMFEKVWSLRKTLDRKVANRRERLIVLGDYNTMGLNYPSRRVADKIVKEEKEIGSLSDFAGKNKMTLFEKSHDLTWRQSKGSMTSDLDHVMASDVVKLKTLGQRSKNGIDIDFPVQVAGWVDKNKPERNAFLRDLSDHCSLTVEVLT